MSRLAHAWARGVLRWRWLVVLVLAVITGLAVASAARDLRVETSTEYFAQEGTTVRENLDAYRADFGRDDTTLVLVQGPVYTAEFLTRLHALHTDLETLEVETQASEPEAQTQDTGGWGDEGWGDAGGSRVIEEVTSLVSVRQTRVDAAGTLRVEGLMPTVPDDPAAFEALVRDTPGVVGHVVDPGGQSAVLLVRAAILDADDGRALDQVVRDAAMAHAAPDFTVHLAGGATLEHTLSTALLRDLRVLAGVAALIMSGLLALLFRRPAGVLIPLVVVVLSVAWTLGSMAFAGAPVTLISNIVPAFLVCVGLGDSVHVLSVFRDQRAAGMAKTDAIEFAVQSTAVPVLFTSATTAAGLLSLRLASTHGIQEMGTHAALGVVFAMVLSLTVVPIALSVTPDRPWPMPAQSRWIDALLHACTNLSATVRGRRLTLGAGAVLVAIAGVGIAQVEVFHDPSDWLPREDPTRAAMDLLDDGLGGASSLVVMVHAPGELGVRDRDVLVGLEQLDAHIRAFESPVTGIQPVTQTHSLVDVVVDTHVALHPEAARGLPHDQRGVSDALLLFETAAPRDLARLTTGDLAKTQLHVRTLWMDATSYAPLTDHVQQGIDRYLPAGTTAIPTGTVYSVVSVVGGLIGDLVRSFGGAAVAITVMMILLLRDAKLALVAMVPNLVPVALVVGFMGWAGIPLDLATLLIASIVIGVAVDDTIHYLHHFKEGAAGGVEAGIACSLEHTGRALVSTSVVLTLGFGSYLASSLMNIQRFGLLVALACVVALFTDLILVPALLRAVYGGARA